MATGILVPGRRLITQPQYAAPIDYAGLGKGAQILFNPALGPVDLVTGRVWTAGNLASVKTTLQGRGFDFRNGGDYYGYTGYDEITSNIGTFFLWMPDVGISDSFGHVVFGASSPNISGHQVYPDLTVAIGSNSPSTGTLSSWFNTKNRSLVLVSGGTAATCKAYLDGVDTGLTWTDAPVAWGAGNKNFNLGRYVGATGFQFIGSILSIGNTSAVWSAAEAKAFHDSRGNALYKAPSRRLWVAVSGGTAYTQALAGSLTATGALTKQTSKPLAGSSTPAGALSRLTAKYPAGSITSTGNLVKQTAKSFAGSITGTGAVSTMILFTAAVAGSITVTGAIAKMTLKALTGSSTLSGAITKMTSKGLSASISLSGALNKLTTKAFAGSVTVTGALFEAYQVVKSLSGSITPAGALATAYVAFVAGVLKMLSLMGVGQ